MAEWLKAAVLKTVSRRRDVGSNPTPSAFAHFTSLDAGMFASKCYFLRRDGRAGRRRSPAKRVRGESSSEGSNPSLSAIVYG